MERVYQRSQKMLPAANRYLLIAETTRSLKGRLSKLRDLIGEHGFEIYSDEEKGEFIFIEARELRVIY